MKHFVAIRNTWKGYLLAAVISGTVMLAKLGTAEMLGEDSLLVLFPLSVLVAAWYCGLGPGLLAVLLSTAGATFFFIDPIGAFWIDVVHLQDIAFIGLTALTFCGLVVAVHRSRETLEHSEQQATDILESISDTFFSVDREWRFTYVNRKAAETAERSPDDMVGHRIWDVFPELSDTPLGGTYRKAMGKNKPMHAETRGIVTGNWYETNFYPSEEGLFVYGRDITERKRAEEKLRESEKRLRMALDAATMVAWEWDAATNQVIMTDKFDDVFGIPPAVHVRDVIRHIHPDDRRRHQQIIKEATAVGESYHLTFRIVRPDNGEITWLEEWGRAEYDERGDIQRMVGVSMDVTDRMRTEEALRNSEEMLQRILDQLPVGIILANVLSGQTLYFNEEARRKLQGMQPPATLDEYAQHEIYHADGTPYASEDMPLIRGLRGDVIQGQEGHYPLPDGSTLVLSISAGPVRNAQGTIVRAISTFHDISERKEMEEELRRQATILQLSHDAMFVWRLEGKIAFWNRGAEELYGFSTGEAVGRMTHELLQAELPVPWEQIETTMREKGKWEGEVSHTSKSGKKTIVAARKQLVEEPDGDLVVLETNRDITERKKYEEGLEQAKQEAEELAQAKTVLLANMSHEVRTPLTGLLLLSELLAKRLPGPNRELVLKIKKGAEKLSDLLNAVLTLSRLEAGHVEVQQEVLDIAQEIKHTTDPLAPLAEQKGISFQVEASDSCYALVDGSSLDSVLNNLIGNAIKFTNEGTVTVTVNTGADDRVDGRAVIIRVQDSGPGIAPEFLPYVFDEFRQESTGKARKFGGAGLGLAISKRLVDLMGGVIELESAPGEGSTFTLILPGATGTGEEESPDEGAVSANEGNRQILFMDDDELTRELIPDLLENMYHVEKAATPQEAMERATATSFDALLLDISMQNEWSGEDVLRALRQHPDYHTVPIIAVTAYALPGDEARFLKAGFNGYLSKPFDRAMLIHALNEAFAATHR